MRALLPAIAILVTSGIVDASPAVRQGKPILVFESHTGPRTDGASRLLTKLEEELETYGFAARPASILQAAGGRVPRPGILDDGKSAAKVAQDVRRAHDEFINGRPQNAKVGLTSALLTITRNPGLFVVDTSNADTTFMALATLALCHRQLGDGTASLATMKELIRMFPSRPFPRRHYGPDDETFHRDVAKQVQAMGRGRMAVSGGSGQAVIFVDGQIRGIGKASLADLVPGTYHVFVQVPGTVGRHYEVEVAANDDSYLNVDPELDGALWATDSWVGFQFSTDAERGKEARYAVELGKRWTGAEQVAVVGPMQLRGRPAVIGTLYHKDGRPMRSAVIEHDEAGSTTSARALARFLADGTPGQGLQILREDTATRARADRPRRSRAYPKVVVGLGLAAIVAGGVLIALDEDFTPEAGPTVFDSAPAGVALAVTGAVATAIGVYLWGRKSGKAPVVTVARGSALVGWQGRF
ncbi:MAG: hypothetical protein KF773_15030 [Deltaproteobacteria bacterium]|nr:hypothetical protein [Deltaproteobacteria bacterium]